MSTFLLFDKRVGLEFRFLFQKCLKKISASKMLYSNQCMNKEPIKEQKPVSSKPKSMIDTTSIESVREIATVDVVNVHCNRRMYSLQACNLNTLQNNM